SGLAELALLVYCADLLPRRAATVGDWRAVLRPVGLMFCFFGGLVMLQPDMGTTIILAILTGTILFVGGVRMRHMAAVLGTGFGAGAFLAIVEPYRRDRLMSFIDPFSHYKARGYQVAHSLLAPDRFGSLLAAGITGWIVGQAIINVGAVTGALPVTGVPLPFVSFGGSALLFTMCATGVLLNVARQGR